MILPTLRFLRLLALAWTLSHDVEASWGVARDATEATNDEWSQRWLIVWSWHESRFRADAVDPTGATKGAMQVDGRVWGVVPAERDAQLMQAVEALDTLIFQCGSRRRALDAYSTGRCECRADLVTARCGQIGGCGDH